MKRILLLIVCIYSCFLVGCASPNEQLQNAIDQGNVEQAQQSLKNGADPCSALAYAVQRKQVNIARLLLSHGANPNQSYSDYLVEGLMAVDPKTNEQFALTTKQGQDGVLRIIPADLNMASEIIKGLSAGRFCYRYKMKKTAWRTPLYTAIDNSDAEMVRILLEYGADAMKSHVIVGFNPNVGGPFMSPESQIASILNGAQAGVVINGVSYWARQDGEYVLSNMLPVQGDIATAIEYARSQGKTELVQILESAAKAK